MAMGRREKDIKLLVAKFVKLVESLVALGLRTSKRDEYALPPAKPVTGPLSGFTLP